MRGMRSCGTRTQKNREHPSTLTSVFFIHPQRLFRGEEGQGSACSIPCMFLPLTRRSLHFSAGLTGASQVALAVKNPPANAGHPRDVGRCLGRKDPLEEEMATYSSILAWRVPWTEEPDRLQSRGSHRVGRD